MNKPLTPEQVRQIAASAGLVFRNYQQLLTPDQQQSIARDLQMLQDPRLPSDRIPAMLGHVRSAVQFLLGKPGVDMGALQYCERQIDALIGPVSRPSGRVPAAQPPSPARGQALPPHPPRFGEGGTGQTTVPYPEVIELPGKAATRPPTPQPPHQTVQLPADEIREVRPSSPHPQPRPGATRPDMTRKDKTPTPEKGARKTPAKGEKARKGKKTPSPAPSAPLGLVSGESPQPSGERRNMFPDLSGDVMAGQLSPEQRRQPGETIYISASDTIAEPHAAPEEINVSAPQTYRAILAVVRSLFSGQVRISDEQFLQIMERQGLFEQGHSPSKKAFFDYLETKSDFTKEDEYMVSAFVEGIQKLMPEGEKAEFPAHLPQLRKKYEMGYLGFKCREALREQGYEVVKCIGRGGMGAVFLVRNTNVGGDEEAREEALKIIAVPGLKLEKEAALGGKFRESDGVVPVHHAGLVTAQIEGNEVIYPFVTMDFLGDVRDLNKLPEDLGLLPRLVASLGMVKSVQSMHEKGVLHRDLKPANFLVLRLENGDIMTLMVNDKTMIRTYGSDFGLARRMDEQDDRGRIVGTPMYMAPEQARGEPLTAASDVFSLGLSIYNVLTDTLPYPDDILHDGGQIITYVGQLQHPAVQSHDRHLIAREVPEKICKLLEEMTDPDPEKRPEPRKALRVIEKYLTAMRPDARKAKNMSLIAMLGLPTVAVALLAALVSIPFVSKSNRRGEFMKAQEQSLRSAEEAVTARNWQEAITLLQAEKERIVANEDLSASERQAQLSTVEDRLTTAREGLEAQRRGQREAAARSDRLISEGDALLEQQNFSDARAKYQEARTASTERASVAAQRLSRVAEGELAFQFSRYLLGYHQGDSSVCREAFGMIQPSSLTQEQRSLLELAETRLRRWAQHGPQLQAQVVSALGWSMRGTGADAEFDIPEQMSNPGAALVRYDEWLRLAADGDADAFHRALMLHLHLKLVCEHLMGDRDEAGVEELRRTNPVFVREELRFRQIRQLLVSGTIEVAAGDTLAGLATRYGVPAQNIADRNRLPRDAVLVPGQRLRISGAAVEIAQSRPLGHLGSLKMFQEQLDDAVDYYNRYVSGSLAQVRSLPEGPARRDRLQRLADDSLNLVCAAVALLTSLDQKNCLNPQAAQRIRAEINQVWPEVFVRLPEDIRRPLLELFPDHPFARELKTGRSE